MVGVKRLELPAPWSQIKCATKLRYTPKSFPYRDNMTILLYIYFIVKNFY